MYICQFLPEVKVQVEERAAVQAVAAKAAAVRAVAAPRAAAVREAAVAWEEAAAAVSVRAPAGPASAWPAVKKYHTNRESPVLKSSVPDAGP